MPRTMLRRFREEGFSGEKNNNKSRARGSARGKRGGEWVVGVEHLKNKINEKYALFS